MKKETTDSYFVESESRNVDITFAENVGKVIEIDEDIYMTIAQKVTEAIEEREFFSGNVCCGFDEFCATFTATLLIYHQPHTTPEGSFFVARDIVPVWWEFSTVTPDGLEVSNDFSFATLKHFLIDSQDL